MGPKRKKVRQEYSGGEGEWREGEGRSKEGVKEEEAEKVKEKAAVLIHPNPPLLLSLSLYNVHTHTCARAHTHTHTHTHFHMLYLNPPVTWIYFYRRLLHPLKIKSQENTTCTNWTGSLRPWTRVLLGPEPSVTNRPEDVSSSVPPNVH